MIVIDFETEGIVGNPLVTPPRPIGVAIYAEGQGPFYTDDWGILLRYWEAGLKEGMLFHNAPFDIEVGVQHLGLPRPPWEVVHDTMYALFLADPYANSLSLKPSAERYLNEPPEEQNELHNWILANVPEATKKTAGAYICRAPRSLVEPYAIGDVTRTKRLYDKLMPNTPREPYDRERELSPILIEGTQRGILLARDRLGEDIERYESAYKECRDRIITCLGCTDSINLDSGDQLAAALYDAGYVREFIKTPTGKPSTAKENLEKVVEDKSILELLEYYSSLGTCLGTFMLPWYEMSEADDRVHPEWNSVRNTDYKGVGTRTGRLSSSAPNFQNVPNPFGQPIPAGLPPLPEMRVYCLPEPGHKWLKRDFSSQEVRILAHFEDGELMQLYQQDPNFDPHELAKQRIHKILGRLYDRKQVKITAFAIIYGSGATGLSGQLKCEIHEAAQVKDAYLRANPGVEILSRITKRRGSDGRGITTWGGRHYYVEPTKIIKGRMRHFDYKLLNYLIQGSAADQTKQCIIDWHNQYRTNSASRYLATVHDEINISAPADVSKEEMTALRQAMEQDLFDVPMRSEGFVGDNWQDIEETT